MRLLSAKRLTGTPFISVTYPETEKHSSQQRSIIHSCAARKAHAKVRVARVKAYQIAKATASQQEKGSRLFREGEQGINNAASSELNVELESEMAALFVPNGGLGRLGSGRRDPFVSFVRPLTNMEHFLLDQYATAVSPYLLNHCTRFRVPGSKFVDSMIEEWIRLSLSDAGFLSGILLIASRYLSIFHQPYQPSQHQLFTEHATRYKVLCLQALNQAISSSTGKRPFSDAVIAETMVLALDEISLGDLETSRRHMQGAVKMVELNGGPQTLGLDGFLEMVLHKFTDQVGMLSGSFAPTNGNAVSKG